MNSKAENPDYLLTGGYFFRYTLFIIHLIDESLVYLFRSISGYFGAFYSGRRYDNLGQNMRLFKYSFIEYDQAGAIVGPSHRVLLILVGIAALLIPLHHRLEKRAIVKLIEKNKRVRLAAARLTIAKLESGK